jgi:hypothetical protein
MVTNVGQNTGYFGAYLYNPLVSGIAPSIERADLSAEILKGTIASVITCDDVSEFPDAPGLLMIDYGTDRQEGPIKYIAVPNSTSLYLDPAYVFQQTHPAGSTVNVVRSLLPTQPSADAREYATYITDTTVPRETLKDLLRAAAAASVVIRFIVVLPENVYNAYSLYE